MEVIKDVLENGPIAAFTIWMRGVLISLFSIIVCVLLTMLVVLLYTGYGSTIRFGY